MFALSLERKEAKYFVVVETFLCEVDSETRTG